MYVSHVLLWSIVVCNSACAFRMNVILFSPLLIQRWTRLFFACHNVILVLWPTGTYCSNTTAAMSFGTVSFYGRNMADINKAPSSRKGYCAHLTKILQNLKKLLKAEQPLSDSDIITLWVILDQLQSKEGLISHSITAMLILTDTNSVSTQYQSVSTPSWDHHGTNIWKFHLNALVLLLALLIFYNESHTRKNLFQDGLRLSETEFSISPSKLVSA